MLEEQIAKLNENIAYLNKLLEIMADTAKTGAVKAKLEKVEDYQNPVKEEVITEQELEGDKPFTHDDIKKMAMAVVRKDRSYQAKIKEKLSEHDARVATDLNDVATQDVGEWLEGVKEELGA